jgi:hypothetical protein
MATDCLKELLGGSNCTGNCIYSWNGSQYVLVGGSCSGGSGCPSCQQPNQTNSEILRGLVLALGTSCFPTPDNITVNCGVNVEDLAEQLRPVLKQHKLCKVLTKLSAALSVVSCLLLGGLVYAIFFR